VIDELLADPGWQRLLAAARRKLERTQGELTGSVGIAKPAEAERRVVIGITGRTGAPTSPPCASNCPKWMKR
jgi:hypothetical protein